MNEFENLQRLLRLKQYETPGDDFVEDFVAQFRERQRSEILRVSARGLFWERLNTFFSDLVSPKWATAAATACFAVVAAWGTLSIVGSGNSIQGNEFAITSSGPLSMSLQKQPAFAVESELIKNIQTHDEVLEIEGVLLSRHFEGSEVASTTGALTPISMEMLPISDFGR